MRGESLDRLQHPTFYMFACEHRVSRPNIRFCSRILYAAVFPFLLNHLHAN
jgi:hypothetical protein